MPTQLSRTLGVSMSSVYRHHPHTLVPSAFAVLALVVFTAAPAHALEKMCDPSFENCRTPLLNLIKAETVGIDVGMWFMEDARYATELTYRKQAGVPVRMLMDPR